MGCASNLLSSDGVLVFIHFSVDQSKLFTSPSLLTRSKLASVQENKMNLYTGPESLTGPVFAKML